MSSHKTQNRLAPEALHGLLVPAVFDFICDYHCFAFWLSGITGSRPRKNRFFSSFQLKGMIG